jgi:hypothetical protein
MRNKKTSTAALDSVQKWPAPIRGAFLAILAAQEGLCGDVPYRARWRREFQQAVVSCQEDAMRTGNKEREGRGVQRILLVILRITLSLILWTLGSGMVLELAAEPVKEHRVVYTFAVDRAQMENLQRWVNEGHDTWCRDPKLVAVMAMRRLSEEYEEVEAASMPLELESQEKREAVYTFHSLDGLKTSRMTLRRFEWLMPTAGALHRTIWVPEKVEIVTRATLD